MKIYVDYREAEKHPTIISALKIAENGGRN